MFVAQHMLRVPGIEAAPVCAPLLKAAHLIRDKTTAHDQPTGFLRRNSKWHRHLGDGNPKHREVAVPFHIRDAFRSGDIWLTRSERFADLTTSLAPASTLPASKRLAVPLNVEEWIARKKQEMTIAMKVLGRAAR